MFGEMEGGGGIKIGLNSLPSRRSGIRLPRKHVRRRPGWDRILVLLTQYKVEQTS
jgi:hypothetical protein